MKTIFAAANKSVDVSFALGRWEKIISIALNIRKMHESLCIRKIVNQFIYSTVNCIVCLTHEKYEINQSIIVPINLQFSEKKIQLKLEISVHTRYFFKKWCSSLLISGQLISYQLFTPPKMHTCWNRMLTFFFKKTIY